MGFLSWETKATTQTQWVRILGHGTPKCQFSLLVLLLEHEIFQRLGSVHLSSCFFLCFLLLGLGCLAFFLLFVNNHFTELENCLYVSFRHRLLIQLKVLLKSHIIKGCFLLDYPTLFGH
jgi:hypothetical protein